MACKLASSVCTACCASGPELHGLEVVHQVPVHQHAPSLCALTCIFASATPFDFFALLVSTDDILRSC